MTTTNRPTQHGAKANVDGSTAPDSAGRPTPKLILDGVIASYIHEISERHQQRQTAGDGGAFSEGVALSS
jgi:hypothetical protein